MANIDDVYASRFDNLGTTTGAIPFRDATTLTNLPIGANGDLLSVVGGLPAWTTPAATGFTVAGDGGTPQSIGNGDTLTIDGQGLIVATAAATDTIQIALSPGTNGQFLSTVGGVPAWAASPFTGLSLAGDTGTPEAIANGNTITIAGGTLIDTVVGATDTVTVGIEPGTNGQVITTVGGVAAWANPEVDLVAAPAASGDPGADGQIAIDANYFYMYNTGDGWGRIPIQYGW